MAATPFLFIESSRNSITELPEASDIATVLPFSCLMLVIFGDTHQIPRWLVRAYLQDF